MPSLASGCHPVSSEAPLMVLRKGLSFGRSTLQHCAERDDV